MLESKFKTQLIKSIEERFPGCMVLHTDPTEIQGIPDLLVLYKKQWAALEGKKSEKESRQPNQEYYINEMKRMSYASFVYPENKEVILDEMEQAFGTRRKSRISKRK